MTGPSLRKLVLGTAGLGAVYGAHPEPQLTPETAVEVLRSALDRGISTFDTAPAYGDAERLLGEAVGQAGRVWTKVDPGHGRAAALRSVASSAEKCRRRRLDLVQWHNWSAELAATAEFRAAHEALAAHPAVGGVGATTYGVEDAHAAVSSGLFSVVQVEWNLLNQSVVGAVSTLARDRGVKIAVRSVLLQGVLADADRPLPERLQPLEEPRAAANATARCLGLRLEQLALRAAIDCPDISHVLVGVRSAAEVAAAVGVAMQPSLDRAGRARCQSLHLEASSWTDPRRWPDH